MFHILDNMMEDQIIWVFKKKEVWENIDKHLVIAETEKENPSHDCINTIMCSMLGLLRVLVPHCVGGQVVLQ